MLPVTVQRAFGDAEYVGGSSGNKPAQAASVTLAADGVKRTYLTGFDITGTGATAASVVTATITGLVGGTRSYVISVPAGAGVQAQPISVDYHTPFPAVNETTDIVVSVPSFGAGNTNLCVNARGFKLNLKP